MEYTLQPIKQPSLIEQVKEVSPTKAIKEHQKQAEYKESLGTKKDLQEVLDLLNKMPFVKDTLSFGFSEDIGQLLVLIKDKKTEDIIRQYPSEDFINRLMYYRDNIGIVFDERV